MAIGVASMFTLTYHKLVIQLVRFCFPIPLPHPRFFHTEERAVTKLSNLFCAAVILMMTLFPKLLLDKLYG